MKRLNINTLNKSSKLVTRDNSEKSDIYEVISINKNNGYVYTTFGAIHKHQLYLYKEL